MHSIGNRKHPNQMFVVCLAVSLSMIIVFVLLFSSCGKKASPVPPRHKKPPAVNDLRTTLDDDTLILTWAIPKKKGKIVSDLTGFLVYRSKMPLLDANWEVWPIPFKLISDIPLEVKGSKYIKKGNCTYTEILEKGYWYIYKVIAYRKGIKSSDSNYVDLFY